MAEVIFNYGKLERIIKCNIDTKIKDIINEFSKNINIDPDNLYYIYQDNEVIEELTFFEQANEFDRFRKTMNIFAYNKKDIKEINEIDEMISKDIICPECKENTFLTFKDFKFNFYGCKKNHNKTNITLFKYDESQKLDTNKLKCSQCNTNQVKINELYICNTCNKNICKVCKLNHDKNHIIINYEDKNYICKKHNKEYKKYCKTCKEDICITCENEHNNHNIFNLGEILLNKNELFYSAKKLKKLLKRFNFKIEMIKLILDEMRKMMFKYYDIYLINIINYDMNKKNYSKLKNLNYLYNKNETLIKDLINIIEDDKVYEFSKKNFYNEYGDKYVGDMDNLKLKEGKGLLYYNDDDKFRERYEGEFKNNVIEGKGFMFYKNGNTFEGSFKNNKMEGKGIFNFIQGNKYIGEYKGGLRDGKGIVYYSNGKMYDGEWKNGYIEGKGILFLCGGGYIGEWKNEKYNGKGTFYYSNGNIIEGIWKDGKPIQKEIKNL